MNKDKKSKNFRFPQRGEIWIVSYNEKNIKRQAHPSLILSSNNQRGYDKEITVALISSKNLEKIRPFEVSIKPDKENCLEKNSKILLHPLRTIEIESCLGNYIGVVKKEIMVEVDKAMDIVFRHHQIEVPLYGYSREKVEKELAEVDSSLTKKALKRNWHRVYAYQFYLSDNPYLEWLSWWKVSIVLSEKGKVVIVKKYGENGKIYYIPAYARINYISKEKEKIREVWVKYSSNGEEEKLTNPNDYQIIFNNPEGKRDLAEFEKYFNSLVSIQNKISEEIINQYPRMVLNSSRPLEDKEMTDFKKQWEEPNMFIFLPSNTNLLWDGRPPLKTGELWEKFKNVKRELISKIDEDIKKNKNIKFEERNKTLKEMEKKWEIKLAINHRHTT